MTTASPAGAAAGVWTLAGERPIIADADGPATLLVPAEKVLLLSVDLPLASHAKRLAALPFAIEDRIADPLEAVHLALGAELSPRRYLVGVVRHTVMAEWIARADAAGLAEAAFVPDCLSLPVPPEGAWSVEAGAGRVMVRGPDATGFAVPMALLSPTWEAAGRPAVANYGEALPEAFGAEARAETLAGLAERLLNPALDLRQGGYARRPARSALVRKLATVALVAVAAHGTIAAADTLMLRSIADRREADVRELLVTAAPDLAATQDVAASVADRLPQPSGANRFLPLLTRVSQALQPLAASVGMRTLSFAGNRMVIELDAAGPDLAARVRAALAAARIEARVEGGAGGGRITAVGA